MNTPASVTYTLHALDGTSKTRTTTDPGFMAALARFMGVDELRTGQAIAGVTIDAVERETEVAP